jgi:hypothetical protein
VELTIRLTADGLRLTGTVGDKLQVLGLLAMAQAAVLQPAAAPAVQVPGPGLTSRLLAPAG